MAERMNRVKARSRLTGAAVNLMDALDEALLASDADLTGLKDASEALRALAGVLDAEGTAAPKTAAKAPAKGTSTKPASEKEETGGVIEIARVLTEEEDGETE